MASTRVINAILKEIIIHAGFSGIDGVVLHITEKGTNDEITINLDEDAVNKVMEVVDSL